MRFLAALDSLTLSVQSQDSIDGVPSTIRLAFLPHAMISIWDLQGVEVWGSLAQNMGRSLVMTVSILETDAPCISIYILSLGDWLHWAEKYHKWWVYRLADIAMRMSNTKWESLLEVLKVSILFVAQQIHH